jgi:hypothetical protein
LVAAQFHAFDAGLQAILKAAGIKHFDPASHTH